MGLLGRVSSWFSRSLVNQLLSTYLIVLTMALGIVTVWALVMIKAESTNDLRNALEVEAVNLGLEIDNDLLMDSLESRRRIKAAVDRHASKLGISITVVDRDGHVLVDSGKQPQTEGENISNQPEINDALAGIAGIYERSSGRSKSDWLFVAYPVRSHAETTGVIRVGVPLTEINQRLHKDLIIFLGIIFGIAVVTVLASLWLSRRLTKPVIEMSRAAREVAISGDISEFVPVRSKDEIGELGDSFNQMIGRLREQERMRQEFVANASHELKTPTMAIGSVVEALQAGAAEDPVLRARFLASLENLVDRQSRLLKDLLDITQLDWDKTMPMNDTIDLHKIVQESVDEVTNQAEKKEVVIHNKVDKNDDVPIVFRGNYNRLHRAFINLLTNAVTYTPSGGSISIGIKELTDKFVDIQVEDTGVGMEAADLPYIFDRFYRADKARTRTAGGTGLGLAITREIILRHQGSIAVESIPGKGSIFTVRLPLK